jgi:hypothetical protein
MGKLTCTATSLFIFDGKVLFWQICGKPTVVQHSQVTEHENETRYTATVNSLKGQRKVCKAGNLSLFSPLQVPSGPLNFAMFVTNLCQEFMSLKILTAKINYPEKVYSEPSDESISTYQ